MKVMIFLSMCIFFILILPKASALIINEIMYNPEGDDNNLEYLEIYFENWTNLTDWIIADLASNDTLVPLQILPNNNYALIVEEGFNYTNINASIYSTGATIGNNLNNDGIEVIFLYDSNQTLNAIATYNDSMGADGDGKSLQLCNGSLVPNFPTPGTLNNCTQQEVPQQPQESSIKIIDFPNHAKFGENIEVEVEIYRGNTSKYAVYVYVEKDSGEDVSEKISFHCDEKFQNYTKTFNLKLDCENEEGNYIIVAEGLGKRDEKEIEIDICEEYENLNKEENETNEQGGSEGVTIGDFTYILTIPNTIYVANEFSLQVKIISKAEHDQEFLVWSYVYISSKCYSCTDAVTRESNAKSIVVPAGSSSEVELKNIVNEAEPGMYKLKIKILQQGLKTPKEFTYDIVLEQVSQQSNLSQQTSQLQQLTQQTQIPSLATYSIHSQEESKQFSFEEILPYILVSIALLAAIYLIIVKI